MEPIVGTLIKPWYAITTPQELPVTAPLWKREVVRRARIISQVMLVTVFLAALPLFFDPSMPVVFGLITAIAVDGFALCVFNRRGKIFVSGLLIFLVTEVGIMLELIGQIILYHQGHQGWIHLGFIPFLTLLIQGVAVAASTLDIAIAFMAFVVNLVFLIVVIRLPYAPDLAAYMMTAEGKDGLIVIPVSAFVVGFFFIAIWVASANDAIRRADSAEEHTRYMAQMAQQRGQELVDALVKSLESVLLEEDAFHIPVNDIPEGHLLWPLHVAVETLQERVSDLAMGQQRTQQAVERLLACLQAGDPLQSLPLTQTIVDPLLPALERYLYLHTQSSVTQVKEAKEASGQDA